MSTDARYRVQVCFGMDSVHRDFSEALTALRSYKRLSCLGGYCPPKPNQDILHVRLWNLTLNRVLASSEGAPCWFTSDPEIVDALIYEGRSQTK
jgi:hypothetical protein